MLNFTEAQLEAAIIELLEGHGYPYVPGNQISRAPTDIVIRDDLRAFLAKRYADDDITSGEIDSIIRQIELLPASDLYESNKTFCI